MQIVIEIPDRIYKRQGYLNIIDSEILRNALKDGTPLPKGHGRLVDLDKMCADYWDGNYMEIHEDDLPNIPIIIEAERKHQKSEESEEERMTTTYEIDHQGWIIDKNGDKQLEIAMEECAELIQAISKYDRYKDTDARYKVIEEMADVLICMEQLKILCNINDEEIQGEIDFKCKRTEERYG